MPLTIHLDHQLVCDAIAQFCYSGRPCKVQIDAVLFDGDHGEATVSATVTRLPSVAPELCGHTSWSQVPGGPRVCMNCCSELTNEVSHD